VWRQTCADVFGVPVLSLDSSKGAALGAAIQAGWTQLNENGHLTCLADLCERFAAPSAPVLPDPSATAIHTRTLDSCTSLRGQLGRFLQAN
jgi:xylulokinase